MLMVGLTGGIGSGKSAVSRLLAEHGAVVIDADLVAREVVEPGTEGLAEVVAEFGERVLRPDGTLDRPKLGALVFADPEKLQALNGIVHPLIGQRTADLLAQARAAGARVLVHDVPLLVESHLAEAYDAVVVVAAEPETQLHRLTTLRGMSEQEARQRIAAQAPLADKLAVATHVIANDGPLEELAAQVDRLWHDLTAEEASTT
ncbi:MAG: dephospho-CoA kinase [Frankiales bacterium]|nr:MAG: dephospho-CoA kinase [Frankiales bacterium]